MTFLEKLRRARGTPIPYFDGPQFIVVEGDANHWRNPGSSFHLNSTESWVSGPRCKSTMRAQKQAEYLRFLVNNAEKIERLIEAAQKATSGMGCDKCAPYEGCNSTMCESVEEALAALDEME